CIAELLWNPIRHNIRHHLTDLLICYAEHEEIGAMVVKNRHFTSIDGTCIGNNVRVFTLAEDGGQIAHIRHTTDNNVLQDIACTDAGQLVHIPYQQDACMLVQSTQEMVKQPEIEHRAFIYNHHVSR